MRLPTSNIPAKWIWSTVLVLCAGLAVLTWNQWAPAATRWVQGTIASFRSGGQNAGDDDHSESPDDHAHGDHDHGDHAHGHDDATSLELSAQALRNIGLSKDQIRAVELQTYRKSITVPARVAERPGRTRVQVATPMTGVITHVHAVQGEAVDPGTLLFQIRLTHEDLVQVQTDFLRTLGELDVEEREIARLTDVTRSGAVAGKLLLEREYARDRLAALLDAQKEALRLHGLSTEQVEQIAKQRRLLRELQVFAPSSDDHPDDELKLTNNPVQPVSLTRTAADKHKPDAPLVLQELIVHKGQSVSAGETLCVLADYSELFIEGLAFEQDIGELRRAFQQGWKVTAVFDRPGASAEVVEGLDFAYLSNEVHQESRTLHFYVNLPNEVIGERQVRDNKFVEWKYLPGQRLQLRVPVEEWPDQIVVPVEALAREGAEYYVFQQNGDHFDRVPVHVKYRDQYTAVIANDGSLFPGDVIAMRGAHQMQMALKNKAGGGADPHAGHTH